MLLSAMAVAAIGLSGPAFAEKAPVKIGYMMPTKALSGKEAVQGAELAVKMINDAGGILGGRKLELVIYDDAFSPVEGVSAVQRLLGRDNIKIVSGNIGSSVALAILPIVRAENALYMATIPKHTDVTKTGYDKIFRLNTTPVMDGQVFNKFILETIKPQKIAMILENSDIGRQTEAVIKRAVAVPGGPQVAFVGYYELQQSDFSAVVTDAKASGADALYVSGATVEQYANVIRQTRELGYNPKHKMLLPGLLNKRVMELAGAAAEGVMSADIYFPDLDNALNKRFVEAFRKAYTNTPEKVEVLGFETPWILAKAIDKAGTATDLGKIAATIRGNTWDSPRGKISFDATGQASAEILIVTVRNGKIVRN
ncbi:MAG: ABC transporter substrate-binding protein [Alphaproteobacteria bacterium]